MQRLLLIIYMFSVFLVSCLPKKHGDNLEDYLNNPELTDIELTLNKGMKWKANTETSVGIRNMITITNDLNVKDSSDYQYLSTVLFDEYRSIFEKCTLMGDAHKQLHAYLVPLSSQILQLKTCNGNCHMIREEIRTYLDSYFEYFE